MLESITEFLNQFPPSIATMMLATLPIAELRLAIPVAYSWNVDPFNAFGLAVLGNFLPFFPLYYGLNILRKFSEKYTPWFTKYIDASVDRAQKRVQEKYAQYGAFALFLFTAIPLPFTGLYTATIAAVALKIPVRYALIGVTSGIIVAGIIVSALSFGADLLF